MTDQEEYDNAYLKSYNRQINERFAKMTPEEARRWHVLDDEEVCASSWNRYVARKLRRVKR